MNVNIALALKPNQRKRAYNLKEKWANLKGLDNPKKGGVIVLNSVQSVASYVVPSKPLFSSNDKEERAEGSLREEGEEQAQKEQVQELSRIDSQVKAHESAHIAAGGGVVKGGASFSYTAGPDGKMYAVAGEVPIDTSTGEDPSENLAKARQIRAAALAPSDPSPQDYRVASTATMLEVRARMELNKERREEEGFKAYARIAEPQNQEQIAPQ